MVFKLVYLCLVMAYVLAAPAPSSEPLEKQQPTVIPIISQSDELESNGTYKFSYETGNGIKREEISYDKVVPKTEGRSAGSGEGSDSDESDEIHVQIGSYSYTAPDGTVITVRYIADENGFRPIGDHLPKAPALVQQAQANSVEKSGRALKVDNAESDPKNKVTVADKAEISEDIVPVNAEPEESPEEIVSVESRSGAVSDVPAETPSAAAPAEASTPAPDESAREASSAVPELITEAAEESSSSPAEGSSTPADGSSTPPEESSTPYEGSSTAAEYSSNPASEQSTTSEVTSSAPEQTTEAASTIALSSDASTTSAPSETSTTELSASSEAATTADTTNPDESKAEAASPITSIA